MSTTVLQAYLEQGLFDIGADDTRLGYFQRAAESYAARLLATPTMVIPAVLVALDPDVSPTDTTLRSAESELQAQWATYRNAYADPPRQLVRAVMLDALHQAAESSLTIAAIIWLVGVNVAPHASLGSEQELIESWLQTLHQQYEDEAIRLWSIVPGSAAREISPLKLPVPQTSAAKLKPAEIQPGFESAMGPSDAQGVATANPNQYWPNNNNHWALQAAPRLATAVASAINKAQASAAADVSSNLESLALALTGFADEMLAQISASVTVLREGARSGGRRTELLWWREALYSPSVGQSYRALTPEVRTLALAVDLSKLTGPFHPTSVEYFLREAVRTALTVAPGDDVPTISLADFLAHVRDADSDLESLRGADLPSAETPVHRPLLGLALAAPSPTGHVPVVDALGLSDTITMPLSEIAVWLYREALALSLASNAKDASPGSENGVPTGKGRRRKVAKAALKTGDRAVG
jgi:hypothetical protein